MIQTVSLSLADLCRTGIPGYDPWATAGEGDHFVIDEAQTAVDFFPECLRHIEGDTAGKPFILEPWQQAIIGNLFGWKRENGSRRYREVLVFVPRKNGKTPLIAGVALYSLLHDGEVGAQNVVAAGERDQASLLYRHCCGMIQQNEMLNAHLRILRGYRMIEFPQINAALKVLTNEAQTKHGGNLHLGIIDELHVQKNRNLYDVLRTGTASTTRLQPLVVYVTTSDFDRPNSICNETVDYAKQVRDGLVPDRAFLPVIYEALPDDDCLHDEAVWERVNPNLDVSVSRDYLRRECTRAIASPGYRNTVLRLHFNLRTMTDTLWLEAEQWDSMADPELGNDLDGCLCFTALDLSSTRDITAFVQLFPLDDGFYYIKPTFWVPEGKVKSLDPQISDRMDYSTWVEQDWVRMTPDAAIDYERIRADICEFDRGYDIADLAIDRAFQGEETAQKLLDMGFDDRVVAFGQGFLSMAAPTKRFDELFYEGKLLHDGNPVMRWMISNAVVKYDEAGNMKPNKKLSTGKIDGVVAAIMALGRAMVTDEPSSRYNDDDYEPEFVEL